MIRFRAGVQVWLFTGRMCEVLQLTSLWSGRTCVDVDVVSINDAPLDRLSAALRAETFVIELATAPDGDTGPEALADFVRGAIDTRYEVSATNERVRVEWG